MIAFKRPPHAIVVAAFAVLIVVPVRPSLAADHPGSPQNLGQGIVIPTEKHVGDLAAIVKRGTIRMLTVYNRTTFFFDNGTPRGIAYDAMLEFSKELNKSLEARGRRLNVEFIPVSRDELLPALREGRGDIAAGFLTVTPERERIVDFTAPLLTDVREIVVTAPGAPKLSSLDDLSGKTIFVNESSSYYTSLLALNEQFRREGRPAVTLRPAPAYLDDEDLLEMLNAGLLQILIIDSTRAQLWKEVFPAINLFPEFSVRNRGDIAWAVRKDSPRLLFALNRFLKMHGVGTVFGNETFRRYLKNTQYVMDATSDAEIRKFQDLIDIFRRYGDQYSMNWMLMEAQGYQESRLDQGVRSAVGAIGVMQVMPATGKAMNVGDISLTEPNIHAGIKYMRSMIDQYYGNQPMDDLNKALFAFAAYNAGPTRIDSLRKDAAKRGLNPNVWFDSVERIAAEKMGLQTVTYVRDIYKYYVAYQLTQEEADLRAIERRQVEQEVGKGSAGKH